MAGGAKNIDINILGRSYKIACEEGEREALLEAVAYLDGKMAAIKNAGKVNGVDRIAVMAALNIAHEFLSTKLGNGFDIGQAKRRISSIEAKLDEVLARQDKLF
jgi:cell division protein ZapA